MLEIFLLFVVVVLLGYILYLRWKVENLEVKLEISEASEKMQDKENSKLFEKLYQEQNK